MKRPDGPRFFFFSLDSSRAVLYAANGECSSNACRKLITRTIKNPQQGVRAQIVLKTDKQTTKGGN